MTGAMYAGIAGLKTHMQDLNVIGNNIANVNTKGYKAGRSVFRTSLYTSLTTGREGNAVSGSKNPSQIGYGSNLASVDIDMSTASFSPGKPTDCMISGDGFFLMGDKETGDHIDPANPNTLKSFNLTRVGDFEFKSDGYLCNNPGEVVYGFLVMGYVNGKPVFSDQLVPIRIPYQDGKGNIMWPTLQTVDENGRVVDAANGTGGTGGEEEGTTRLKLVDTQYAPTAAGADDTATPQEYVRAKMTNISIGDDGLITAMDANGEPVTIGAIAVGTVDNPNGVTQISNTSYKCGAGAGELAVNMVAGAGKSVYVMHSSDALPGQGGEGNDEAYTLPREYGQIDPQGISLGMTYVNQSQVYSTDNADGEDTSLPYGSQVFNTSSQNTLVVGGLETSKTDLATEIANMITTQRGYQANTRIITVTDSMLEELVNMKR